MQERRQNDRLEEQNQVSVTVIAAPEAREIENKTFFCRTADLSVSGLRLRLQTPIPEGAVLALRVAFMEPLVAFRLVGRTSWSRSTGAEKEVGVEFRDCPPQLIAKWREVVAAKIGT